ncbi:ketopantoate reductase family protein [Leptospira jelokensis]|uniref:2-dehydropantoate 2-reductase n=1 Tax=Leptospira jelokensis TaxID=2484931 RepID=A0A4Z1A4D1_9LEPT|nr:ketopantoate reductase C-terminal domain-containing protein [Leptospira jelokensis]TGL75637.1 ketopantoate reductase family protein [Leptospira jelokensis]
MKSPTIAFCGIGSVTVTILHALYQNGIPFTILCQDKTRMENLKTPIRFKGPNQKTTVLNLTNHLQMVDSATMPFDYIFLGCKNQSLENYTTNTKHLLQADGKWIFIQNGLPENHFLSLRDKIIGGVVGWNTQVLSDGSYYQSNVGSLILGDAIGKKPDPSWHQFLEPWIPVVLTERLQGFRWHKLAINAIINGLAASKQSSLGELFLNWKSRNEAIEILSEIKKIMKKLQVEEEVVPGSFPIQKLGDGENALPKWIRHLVLIVLGLKYFKIRTSMVQDLDHKRKTEINFINGEVIQVAKSLGVPVPFNEKVVSAVIRLEKNF